jgi:hypothetical protein
MVSAVVGVMGASGGLGASTLAAALARRFAARRASAALVDADLAGGGIDVTVGIEHLPGLRWADLVDLRGPVDGAGLLAALPLDRGVRLLSAGRGGAPASGSPDPATRLEVLGALAALGPVVIDIPRAAPDRDALLGACDDVVLLCGTHVRGLADADALVEALLDEPVHPVRNLHLVTRGPRVRSDLAAVVESHLGVPHVVHLADDARVARSGERGEWPGRRHTTMVAADAILDAVQSAPLGQAS